MFARLDCAHLGIGLDAALDVDASCRYLCVNGPDGDLRLAVNDMAAMERLTPEAIEKRLPLINASDLIVVDANLPKAALEALAAHARRPLVADPVSAPKAVRMRDILKHLTAIKPNRAEAAALTGLAQDSAAEALAEALIQLGVHHVYLSLGAEGMLYAGPEGMFLAPAEVQCGRNYNGCGDAATAAIAHGLVQNLSAREIAKLAMQAAAEQAQEA